tara:strand:- start:26452 stop:27546 length:1095 start_codon:yes stop_codon:yes gene_type:complete
MNKEFDFKKAYKNFINSKNFLQNNHQNSESSYWKRFNSKDFSIEQKLYNFRSDKLSYGCDDAITNDIDIKKFKKKLVKYEKDIGKKFLFENLDKDNIGNSKNSILYKGRFVDYNNVVQIKWFKDIKKNFKNSNKFIFCEIGGGFGTFTKLVLQNFPKVKILSIDLPEQNLLTYYFLKRSFPNKRFFTFDNLKTKKFFDSNQFINCDIAILPPKIFFKNLKIDFFINARSMMEMNKKTIKDYFDFIHENSSSNSFFLNINRYQKNIGYEMIRIAEYPYDNNWDVIISKESYEQKHIHFLLCKRKFKNFNKNIAHELQNIDKIGQKYYSKIDYLLPLKLKIVKTLTSIFGTKFVRTIFPNVNINEF